MKMSGYFLLPYYSGDSCVTGLSLMHFCFTAPNDCEESEHKTVIGYVLSLSSSHLFVYLFIIFSIDTFRARTYKS